LKTPKLTRAEKALVLEGKPVRLFQLSFNDHVRFKLTQRGSEWLISRNTELRKQGIPPMPLKRDADGFCRMQFHDFIRVFGAAFGVCMDETPVEMNVFAEVAA